MQEDWLWKVYKSQGEQTTKYILGVRKNLNPFVLRTIAIAQVLQSQAMLLLPMNPDFGESIAQSFCKYFSQNIEDYRIRGERSAPL